MDQGGFLARIDADVAARRALSAECYRDPAFFDIELERVLRPGWHAVARWDDLPDVGDYASLDLFGEPLLVVRGADGELGAYSRVCRHRAHTVVEGSGNTKRFVCPYHRWSYDLDGTLKTAPLMEGAVSFEPEACGLPSLRTELWQGFLLVNLDPDAAAIGPELEPLAKRVGELGLAEMKTACVLEFDSPWNWKVMIDNFMESYHHMGPHAKTLQQSNHAKDTYAVEDVSGPFAILENPGVEGASSFTVGQVFPTLLLAVFETDPIGSWYEMQIDSHEHFLLRIHMLAAPEVAEEPKMASALEAGAREIHLEDIEACLGVQRGIGGRLWAPGPLSPLEGCLTRFHAHLAERLRS
jgi:phenylpropionate dioxygenase-like ring-hydroxylating dioxygenase large terminal subunit